MSVFISFIIFIIILFLYVHFVSHFKKSEDLEIYEMDYSTSQHLNEVCELKQPVLFEFENIYHELFQELEPNIFKSTTYDVKIKDVADADSGDYVLLPFSSAETLVQSDTKSRFYSEQNSEFANENSNAMFSEIDSFFKPAFTVQTKYDIIFGSKGAYIPMRYHTEFRKFVCVQSGKIHVKMTPWRSHTLLHPYDDYVNYEFRSPINVWNPQSKYMLDMDKLKFLDFEVKAGYVLYVPPFWFYSIKISNEPSTFVYEFTYNSIMNCLANAPKWGMYFLQQQNTKKKVMKTLDPTVLSTTNESEGQDQDTELSTTKENEPNT
jgi:hypothetical protein